MLNIEVSELLEDRDIHLGLILLAGRKGLSNKINIPRIQKPGLALIGDTSKIHPGRIQVLGKSELTYLKSLSDAKKSEIVRKICSINVSCFIITRDNEPSEIFLKEAETRSIPVFKTSLVTSTLINRVTKFLEEHLTARATIHGVLLDVFGVGIMVVGKSGIGKSECALDLILKGHRLVADDVIQVKKKPPATLVGESSNILKDHIEIRGLGILNIKDLFGVAATREKKLIDIVVELVEWNPNYEYDRLGLDEHKYVILDIPIPYIKIPVSPGRNITTIIEVAARNNLLKARGYSSSKSFQNRLNEEIFKNTEEIEDIELETE